MQIWQLIAAMLMLIFAELPSNLWPTIHFDQLDFLLIPKYLITVGYVHSVVKTQNSNSPCTCLGLNLNLTDV